MQTTSDPADPAHVTQEAPSLRPVYLMILRPLQGCLQAGAAVSRGMQVRSATGVLSATLDFLSVGAVTVVQRAALIRTPASYHACVRRMLKGRTVSSVKRDFIISMATVTAAVRSVTALESPVCVWSRSGNAQISLKCPVGI